MSTTRSVLLTTDRMVFSVVAVSLLPTARAAAAAAAAVTALPLAAAAAAETVTEPLVVKLVDCTAGAMNFFGNARVPATLLAGSALVTLFALSHVAAEHPRRQEAVIRRIDAMFALYSFLLSVVTVLVTTTASTALLVGKFDPMAVDIYSFLKREFRFEFVITRWSLLTSLLAFLVSVCGRLFLEFRLLERKRLAVTALLLMGSLITFLVSHINSSLQCWEHLGGMTYEVVQLIWARIDRPLTFLSVAMAMAGTALGVLDIVLAINNPNVAEEDLQAKRA